MRFCFLRVVAFFFRRIGSLRYSVRVKGFEKISSLDQKKGILFLPNHPAYIDGFLFLPILWSKYFVRVVVADYVNRLFILRPFAYLIKAVPIPNLEKAVFAQAIEDTHAAINLVIEGLKKGESFVIYPAGRLRHSGKEVLGGASFVYRTLQAYPDVQIVLLRVRGLWGSSFSRAITGLCAHVPLPPLIRKGIWTFLKNGIFFCPRRPVEIEFSTDLRDLPREGSRRAINRYLEKWYNDYPNGSEEEPIQLVSRSFWCEDRETPAEMRSPLDEALGLPVSKEVQKDVYSEIRRLLDAPNVEIRPDSNLALDLGLDSLDLATLAVHIAKVSKADGLHSEQFITVRDVLEFAEIQQAYRSLAKF